MNSNYEVKFPSKVKAPDNIANIGRLLAFYGFIVAVMSVIVARLWYLQVMMNADYVQLAERSGVHGRLSSAARGLITDRNGLILATNQIEYNVTVIPEALVKRPQILNMLAELLNVSPESLWIKIPRNKKGKLIPSHEPIVMMKKLDMKALTRLEEMKTEMNGVQISKVPVRLYSDNKMCTHVLGRLEPIKKEDLAKLRDAEYRQSDKIGVTGIEAYYDVFLRGQDGAKNYVFNAESRSMGMLDETSPKAGKTLKLTLDMGLQKAAYEALQTPLSRHHPGAAVAMDVDTGAVLAMVSVPTYDSNTFNKDYREIRANPLKPEINRASGSAYPCGSTFKLVTAAAGLESGVISENSSVTCPGFLMVGKQRFKCDGTHGEIGFDSAVGRSCDVFFYTVGRRVRPPKLEQWAKNFGLGEKTGIDIPTDYPGVVPSKEWKAKSHRPPWVEGDLVNMSIGQGDVGVTPLQLCDYTAAIANGGKLWTPQLLLQMIDVTGEKPKVVRSLEPKLRRNLGLKPGNRDAIVRGMRRVVKPGGTAAGIQIAGLEVAGKTGSAEVGDKSGLTHSVFVCFAPADHPKIAIAVFVEKAGHGADVAAPVARRMLQQYFKLKTDTGDLKSAGGAD